MTTIELHNLLHRAGVELLHRPDSMMRELEMIDQSISDKEGYIRSVCDRYGIPQIPTDRIVNTVINCYH